MSTTELSGSADNAAERSKRPRPGPGAQQDEGRESYYIGECGHRIPAESAADGLLFCVGPCHECDEEPPVNDPRSPNDPSNHA